MIVVTLGEQKINVDPRLTIKRYQKIQTNPQKYNNPTDVLALYLDIEPEELKELPVDEIKFVESVITQHIDKPQTNDIVLTFEFEGVTYGLENDWGNMTWGQWTDLEIFSQKDKLNDNIHIIMALLYRPVEVQNGKTYKLKKFKSSEVLERAELFLDLPVNYWFGCATFFLHISTIYIKDIQNSLKARMIMEKGLKPLKKILPKWLHPKVPQDSILNSLLNLSKETSQNTTS